MIELKFKAYVPALKKTVDVIGLNPINKTVYLSHYQLSGSEGDDVLISFDKSDESHVIVRQFSGHKDKNGVEIYAGSIVTIPDSITDRTNYATVVFEGGAFRLDLSEWWVSNPCVADYLDDNPMEVTGDIFTSPELLDRPAPAP